MDFSLTNKTALVTGSYRGTGFAIAKTLLAAVSYTHLTLPTILLV